MLRFTRITWLLLGVGYVMLAAVVAVLVTVATGAMSATAASDQIAIVHSNTLEKSQSLPATVEEAESDGWNLATWCIKGMGRFFRQGEGEEPDPLLLVFSYDDKLVGINLHSSEEQPSPPWERFPNGITTGFKGRELDHWGLGIYASRPSDACEKAFDSNCWARGTCP